MCSDVKSEDAAAYGSQSAAPGGVLTFMSEDDVLRAALGIAARRFRTSRSVLSKPEDVAACLRLRLGTSDVENFGALLLDQGNRVITDLQYAEGIAARCNVYLRVFLKDLMSHDRCTGVILYHNHPAGQLSFSTGDIKLTGRFKTVLEAIEVRLLDHLIVTAEGYLSASSEGVL